MNPFAWIIVGGAVVVGVVCAMGKSRPRSLDRREDATDAWAATDCSPEAVDQLLDVVCEAFGFDRELKPKLHPDDTPMGLYAIVYPRARLADAMELESFFLGLDEECGLTDEEVDPNLALAAIARKIEEARS